jgi:hypothetical protein
MDTIMLLELNDIPESININENRGKALGSKDWGIFVRASLEKFR